MTLPVPAPSGSESVVGLVRESPWGTTPVTGVANPNKTIDGIIFVAMKEENIQGNPNIDPQTDDMSADREIQRIVDGGRINQGTIRFTPGPESIGYFLTAMFGTPDSSQLHSSSGTAEAVHQHTWYPGYQERADWPVPYSIESQISTLKSKLIQGALLRRMTLDLPNNAIMATDLDIIAKRLVWLYPVADAATHGSGTVDQRGITRPAVMTAVPGLIDETGWHFKQLKAYPQIGNADAQSITAMSWELQFLGLEGLFTGGSGRDIGTYRVDNFQLGGRATVIFEDEDLWEHIQDGAYFALDATLEGDTLQADHKNSLRIQAYSCKFNSADVPNRVGALEYDLPWTARKDPTEGFSTKITLINSVSSYA